jgi:hypothetical protein
MMVGSPYIIPLYSSGHSYLPPALTYQISAFCPQSVFVCSVRFSQLTAIVSLNSINGLVFVADVMCLH